MIENSVKKYAGWAIAQRIHGAEVWSADDKFSGISEVRAVITELDRIGVL